VAALKKRIPVHLVLLLQWYLSVQIATKREQSEPADGTTFVSSTPAPADYLKSLLTAFLPTVAHRSQL